MEAAQLPALQLSGTSSPRVPLGNDSCTFHGRDECTEMFLCVCSLIVPSLNPSVWKQNSVK